MNETTTNEGANPQKHTDSCTDARHTTLPNRHIRILGAATHGARTHGEIHGFLECHAPGACTEAECSAAIAALCEQGYLVQTDDSDTSGTTYDVTAGGLDALADSLIDLVAHVADLRLVDSEAYAETIERLEELESHRLANAEPARQPDARTDGGDSE